MRREFTRLAIPLTFVIADNNLTNTDGIFVWGINGTYNGIGYVDAPSDFTRITGNTLTGISPRTQSSGIGINGSRNSTGNGSYIDVIEYATEISNNTIVGNNTAVPQWNSENGAFSGINVMSYGAVSSSNGNGIGTGDITNTMIEGNSLSTLATGVTLKTVDSGVVVKGNSYDSTVLQFLQDSTTSPYGQSDNTLVTGNGN
jgi:hypothetical protein